MKSSTVSSSCQQSKLPWPGLKRSACGTVGPRILETMTFKDFWCVEQYVLGLKSSHNERSRSRSSSSPRVEFSMKHSSLKPHGLCSLNATGK